MKNSFRYFYSSRTGHPWQMVCEVFHLDLVFYQKRVDSLGVNLHLAFPRLSLIPLYQNQLLYHPRLPRRQSQSYSPDLFRLMRPLACPDRFLLFYCPFHMAHQFLLLVHKKDILYFSFLSVSLRMGCAFRGFYP